MHDAGVVTCFRPLLFWFRPDWPEQRLLSVYPSVAAAAATSDEEEEEDDDDEDDALQL